MNPNIYKTNQIFRPFTHDDIPVMKEINFSNHIDQGGALFGALYDDPNYFVVEHDKHVIAYVNVLEELPDKVRMSRCADPIHSNGICIKQVAVSRSHQGIGAGSFLYKKIFERYPNAPIYAHIHASNRTSALFHLKNGFAPCGVFYSKKHYGQEHYLCFLFVREAGYGQKS